MAFSPNILPRAAAYYILNNASIVDTELNISANGYAEIQVSKQMLPKLTSKMLIVVHPSEFSSDYTNDKIQVNISILTTSGKYIEYLLPVVQDMSGVFNTELNLPEEEFSIFTYKIQSAVDVAIYNWELCSEEAADLTTIINGVEQSLPKLLYDYNTYSFGVAQKEITVGMISCYLLAPTDLQAHFTLSFFSTERCNVHVRVKDNNVTELFSPQVYTVEKGFSSISIPHAYLKKLATEHSFSVTLQCSNGQLSIPVRGLLYTIDGGHLATRLLDPGVDIQDISIKQTPSDTTPSEIWAIGFEGAQLVLKKREYSLLQRVNWIAVKDFGEGITAAIEFPGNWQNRNNADRYTLETADNPFVFIVDNTGALKVYQGDTYETVYELDTGVTVISACQGFGSMYDISQRQGMIVTYIKAGQVYYKQWLYDSSIDAFRWYNSATIYDAGDAFFVSIHRLPDYRVGICISHLTGTDWYITDRTYVGQTVKPEIIKCRIHSQAYAAVLDYDRAPSTVVWPGTPNVFENSAYYNGFSVTYDGQLIFTKGKTLDDLINNMIVSIDNSPIAKTDIKEVKIDGGTITVTLLNDVRATHKVSINFNYSKYFVLRTYNKSIVKIAQSFSWALAAFEHFRTQKDEASIKVTNTTATVTVIPIVTNKFIPKESIMLDVNAKATTSVVKVPVNNLKMTETISLDVSADTTLEVVQTGSTPL